jgi:protein-tyrosine phosphatase
MVEAPSSMRVLAVCSGNLCRSPLAEQLLRARLHDVGIEFSSSGVVARDGDPMPDEAAALSREFGGDPAGHASRPLVEEHVADSALVLGMAREHRRDAVTLLPRASRYTFTLREFARLSRALTDADFDRIRSEGDSAARLAALIEEVAANRGYVPPPEDPAEDDILDPYRMDASVYRRSAEQLVPAVDRVAEVVRRALAGAG